MSQNKPPMNPQKDELEDNTTSDEYLRNMHMDIYFPFDKDKSFQRFKDYHNSLLDTLESELPSNRVEAVKPGELIPSDNDKVDVKWLPKMRDAGYNQAIEDIKKIIERQRL